MRQTLGETTSRPARTSRRSTARRPPDATRTYGYQRAEILAALFNGVVLVCIALFILIEAWERFRAPPQVDYKLMAAIAALEAWETGLTLTGGATVSAVDYPVGCQPDLTGPVDFSASFDTPLPCGVLTKLAVFHLQIAEGIDTLMFLGNVANPTVPGAFPGVRPAGEAWRSVDVASGDPTEPLAAISLPTPTEDSLWGTVKLLYR